MKVTVAAILIFAALIYNAYISAFNVKGYYLGSAITDSAQEISIYFSTTGDGILTGDWRSYSDLRKGIITSRTHLFQDRSFTLNVNAGKCIGEFPIKIDMDGPNLKVYVDTSAAPHCPASAYSFQLKESERPTDPNLLKNPVSNTIVLRIAKL